MSVCACSFFGEDKSAHGNYKGVAPKLQGSTYRAATGQNAERWQESVVGPAQERVTNQLSKTGCGVVVGGGALSSGGSAICFDSRKESACPCACQVQRQVTRQTEQALAVAVEEVGSRGMEDEVVAESGPRQLMRCGEAAEREREGGGGLSVKTWHFSQRPSHMRGEGRKERAYRGQPEQRVRADVEPAKGATRSPPPPANWRA